MPKTIEQDDAMFEEFRYDWMPARALVEHKRATEGLRMPEQGESHCTAEHWAKVNS